MRVNESLARSPTVAASFLMARPASSSSDQPAWDRLQTCPAGVRLEVQGTPPGADFLSSLAAPERLWFP